MRVKAELGGHFPDDKSDQDEDLTHPPVTCHMFRSAFIKAWMGAVEIIGSEEDMAVQAMLGHTIAETSCKWAMPEHPSCATTLLRKHITVGGKPYGLPLVKREADRNVRPYHFYMYHSDRWTREELGRMCAVTKGVPDPVGASHVCGGTCINHAIPEKNSVNQERKPHHAAMKAALEIGSIRGYIEVRGKCNHEPKCFINPGAYRLTAAIIANNQAEYDQANAA